MPSQEKEKPLTSSQHAVKEMLRLLLTIVSDQYGVAPKIIASAEDLEEMARSNKNPRIMTGWRYEIFGKKAEAFKKGSLALTFDPSTKQMVFIENNH